MRLIISLLFALASGVAGAQSLREAVDAAWSRHPQARLLDGRIVELDAKRQAAQAWFAGPGALTLGNRNDRLNRNHGQQEYEAEIGMPLWLPGQRSVQQSLAERESAELEAQRTALRLALTGEVRDAWHALSLARGETALARDRLETAARLEADVQRRLQVGEVSRFDANLARSEQLGAQSALAEAQSKELETDLTLRALTGLEIRGDLPAERPVGAPEQEAPAIAMARSSAAAADARVRATQAATREHPEISLLVRRERADFNETYANSIGVRVRLPFSRTPRTQAQIAAAQAESEQARAALRQAELKVSLEQEKARREVDTARQQQDLAESRRALAADNLSLALKAYQLGESDLSTLLRAQAAHYDAHRAAERARLALIAAQGRVNQAFGVLP